LNSIEAKQKPSGVRILHGGALLIFPDRSDMIQKTFHYSRNKENRK